MVFLKKLLTVLLLCMFISATAQVPFHQGVNLTNWFQAGSAHQIPFSKYKLKDFQNIKDLGCDVIRLPINLHAMTNGAPDYTLDPLFLKFLDQAVDWAEQLKMHLILDNHTFDPAVSTLPSIGPVLLKVWPQMASHYKDRSEYIYYEVLNEPHGIDDATWGSIQQSVIDAIRTQDNKHFIVVGGADWNSFNTLNNIPVYTDSKLIYTFHFYEPFVFTHQGAAWNTPSMAPLAGVPFPYRADAMPSVPPTLKGTWVETALNNYVNTGNVSNIKKLIDIAVDFQKTRKVPVFCGEFGVYIPNSNNEERVSWYKEIRSYFNTKGIPWTMWDYQNTFGLFVKNSNELFDYDLNVPLLNALDWKVPPQKQYQKKPITTGFIIYDDNVGEGIAASGYRSGGMLDYYADTAPKTGERYIEWPDAAQYDAMAFDFKPQLDLTLLSQHDTLTFWVRANAPAVKFAVRFIDSKTGADDHPWRMGKTIDNSFAAWDGYWHRVAVPLNDMEEQGSWDDPAFYFSEHKFDWSSIDHFEIVPEYQPLTGYVFSFDEIRVAGAEVITSIEEPVTTALQIYPNPFQEHTTIGYHTSSFGTVYIDICDVRGNRIMLLNGENQYPGNYQITWSGNDLNGQKVSKGIYLVRLKTSAGAAYGKVAVL